MKRLVLLGAGNANATLLSDLVEFPLVGWDVLLISPRLQQVHANMVPAWICGRFDLDACAARVDSLAAHSGAAFCRTGVVRIDFTRSVVICTDGIERRFDVLSIDGPSLARPHDGHEVPGHPLATRPAEDFVSGWTGVVERILGQCRRFRLIVLGDGDEAVELAFAIRQKSLVDGWSHVYVALVGTSDLPLAGAPRGSRLRVARLLRQRDIAWHGGRRILHAGGGSVALEGGVRLEFDACLDTIASAVPAWIQGSGILTDDGGLISVGPTLQSVSHPHVFAGDAAHSRRAGRVLASNVRAYCEGRELVAPVLRGRALHFVATGGDDAIAYWRGWTCCGAWVRHLKDFLDRRAVAASQCQVLPTTHV